MRRNIAIFAFTMLLLPGLGAQNGQETVEDAYLKKQQKVQVEQMKKFMENSDRDSKQAALDIVGEMIEAELAKLSAEKDKNKSLGKLSTSTLGLAKNEELLGLLSDLAKEGTNRETRVNNRLVNDYPDVRRKAAEYLGAIKGDKAREILVGMVRNEKEPMVLAEIVYSLGLVGPDPSGKAEVTIFSIVKDQNAVRPDNNLAYASISAIREIGKAKQGTNSQVSPELFDALIKIAQGNYIRSVRDEAKKLMDAFRKNDFSDKK